MEIIQRLSKEVGEDNVMIGGVSELFFWNVQGCGHLRFYMISICKVGSIIAKLGFNNSFRVEAASFTGGFCILWNNDIGVKILNAHS
ncbi:hypothetical protein EPI10_023308 [Gossypium australe]|uniref:Uncharacterized protein n=1 Tax=Gossypium australe TaxID=47621 RepID=A0A5B6VV60_9ROSI|nr:hypothetical protein EPI10_023308 [Gossypium australe]